MRMVKTIFTVSRVIIFSLCVTFVHSFGELQKGDKCHHEEKNLPGVCTLLKDCPEARREIDEKKFTSSLICDFEGTIPIVCCAKSSSPNEINTTQKEESTTSNAGHTIPGEISKKKCWEYGQLIYKQFEIPSLNTGKPKFVNDSDCYVKPTFVHGGVNAGSKEFPHMALLGYGGRRNVKWGCGGSLISEKYVLTAAHCVSSRDHGTVKYVRLGDLDISTSNDDAAPQEFDVKNRIRYPKYKRPSTYDDIALLELDRPVTFTDYVRPACLHLTYEVQNQFLVSGWGHLEHDVKQLSNILQKADVEVFSHGECEDKYEAWSGGNKLRQGVMDGTQICAGGKSNDKDTCPGDSGGPLQIIHPEVLCMYSIAGVTSFGQPRCGVTGIPAIYTRVSTYIEWIENIVWPSH